jgi:hypothetical protein
VCSQRTPFPAKTVGGEQEAIETKLMPLFLKGHNTQAQAVNAEGARVLVRCFRTTETLRDRLLAQQQASARSPPAESRAGSGQRLPTARAPDELSARSPRLLRGAAETAEVVGDRDDAE